MGKDFFAFKKRCRNTLLLLPVEIGVWACNAWCYGNHLAAKKELWSR